MAEDEERRKILMIENRNNNSFFKNAIASEFGADEEITSLLGARDHQSVDGLEGVDVLVGLNDCCCKTPLLNALKTQTGLLSQEKESHENTRMKNKTLELEIKTLKGQISELTKSVKVKEGSKLELQNQIVCLTNSVKSAQEAQKNSEILQDRLRSELVRKHGEAAHETQLKNKLETDIEALEKQNEELHRQVQAYDTGRIDSEMARMEEATKRMEAEARLRTVEAEYLKKKEEDEGFIEAMQEQVSVANNAKLAAESNSRQAIQQLNLARESMKVAEEAVEREIVSHRIEIEEMNKINKGLKDDNAKLDQEIARLRAQGHEELKKYEGTNSGLNGLLFQATKEISKLDNEKDDLDVAYRALREEVAKQKDEVGILRGEAAAAKETFKVEKAQLEFQIASLRKSNANLDEKFSEAHLKATSLESDLKSSKQMIEFRDEELRILTESSNKRVAEVNVQMGRASEKLHVEVAKLKNTLYEKTEELQVMKGAILAAGGDLSLLPVDQRIQEMSATIERLKEENEAAKNGIERLSRLSTTLKEEKEELQSRKASVIEEKEKKVEDMQMRTSGLIEEIDNRKNSLHNLREKYENLEGRLFHEQSEKQKLANVLKKHMNIGMPGRESGGKSPGHSKGVVVSLHSRGGSQGGSRSCLEMIPETTDSEDGIGATAGTETDGNSKRGSGGARNSAGENGRKRSSGAKASEADDGASARFSGVRVTTSKERMSLEPSDTGSLEAIKQQVMVAKNYQLKKGVVDTMKAEGLRMSDLEDLADIYDERYLDFEALLGELVSKADSYRLEKLNVLTKIKELKMTIHYMTAELKNYKQLEESLVTEGLVDKDAMKGLKVEAVKKMGTEGVPLDVDDAEVADVLKKKSGEEYVKESLTKMTTLFAEQRHILDNADQFHTFEDLLDALRRDITIETKNLRQEIEEIIKIIDDMAVPRKGGEEDHKNQNVNHNNINRNNAVMASPPSTSSIVAAIMKSRYNTDHNHDYVNQKDQNNAILASPPLTSSAVAAIMKSRYDTGANDVSLNIRDIRVRDGDERNWQLMETPHLPDIRASSQESLAFDRSQVAERRKELPTIELSREEDDGRRSRRGNVSSTSAQSVPRRKRAKDEDAKCRCASEAPHSNPRRNIVEGNHLNGFNDEAANFEDRRFVDQILKEWSETHRRRLAPRHQPQRRVTTNEVRRSMFDERGRERRQSSTLISDETPKGRRKELRRESERSASKTSFVAEEGMRRKDVDAELSDEEYVSLDEQENNGEASTRGYHCASSSRVLSSSSAFTKPFQTN